MRQSFVRGGSFVSGRLLCFTSEAAFVDLAPPDTGSLASVVCLAGLLVPLCCVLDSAPEALPGLFSEVLRCCEETRAVLAEEVIVRSAVIFGPPDSSLAWTALESSLQPLGLEPSMLNLPLAGLSGLPTFSTFFPAVTLLVF